MWITCTKFPIGGKKRTLIFDSKNLPNNAYSKIGMSIQKKKRLECSSWIHIKFWFSVMKNRYMNQQKIFCWVFRWRKKKYFVGQLLQPLKEKSHLH